MSEAKSRASRRNRRSAQNENDETDSVKGGKGVVILAKNERKTEANEGSPVSSQTPTPSQKSQEKEASSSPQVLRSTKTQAVQLQRNTSSKTCLAKEASDRPQAGGDGDSKVRPQAGTTIPEMNQKAKFMNKYFELEEDLLQYLVDETSFKVVAVLGLQGSGKSHVMNILAGKTVFPVEKTEDVEQCRHRTVGIDAYVCSDRTILLDVQPVLALSIMDILIVNEKRTPSGAIDYHQSLESQVMVESLQTASFLMSICHSIVIVFDWFLDRDLAQFIQSAEMLKPTIPKNATTSVLDAEITDYFPHVVFVQNKCEFVNSKDCAHMASSLSRVFRDSMLLFKDEVDNNFPQKINDEKVNIFQIPLKTDHNYEEVCQQFIAKILSMPQEEFIEGPSNTFTEKTWFQYASKIWESSIRKSSVFLEYKRLLV